MLAHLTQTKDFAMVLYTDKLKVIHISTHVALRNFLDNLNQPRVETVIGIADSFLRRVGYSQPRIAVAGLILTPVKTACLAMKRSVSSGRR